MTTVVKEYYEKSYDGGRYPVVVITDMRKHVGEYFVLIRYGEGYIKRYGNADLEKCEEEAEEYLKYYKY